MMTPRLLAVAVAVALVAVAMRVNNALHYFPLFGFDSIFHWRYVQALLETGALPHPEAGWSASRPPLFFVLAAAVVRGLGRPEMPKAVAAVRLVGSAIGLVPALLAARLTLRIDPGRPQRALLAGSLIAFVPAHIYMSAMFNEEIFVASLSGIALYFACEGQRRSALGERPRLGSGIAIGLAAGFAAMTKLTGVLAGAAAIAAGGWAAWRTGGLRRALAPLAAAAVLTALLGGAFYASTWLRYGYLVPHSLGVHQKMYVMPPGNRHLTDYVRFPVSTFTDPRAITFDLQRSVWGTAYSSLWFDSQRIFTPRDDTRVTRVGTAILLLALLPTAAFLVGLARAFRRVISDPRAVELPMLLLTAFTLCGFAAFTWKNPWYATVKGGYLLGLSLPFGFLASEVLVDWASGASWRAWAVWGALAALGLAVAAAFTFGTPLWDWGSPDKLLPGFPYAVPSAP